MEARPLAFDSSVLPLLNLVIQHLVIVRRSRPGAWLVGDKEGRRCVDKLDGLNLDFLQVTLLLLPPYDTDK